MPYSPLQDLAELAREDAEVHASAAKRSRRRHSLLTALAEGGLPKVGPDCSLSQLWDALWCVFECQPDPVPSK